MAGRAEPPRRPSGSRPFQPRRLFSGNASKPKTEPISEDTEVPYTPPRPNEDYGMSYSRSRTPSQPLDLAYMDKALDELDPFADSPLRGGGAWTGKQAVDSPSPKDEQRSFSPTPRSASPQLSGFRPRPMKKASLLSTLSTVTTDTSESMEPPPSPSKRRWDNLRQHVLPAGAAPPRMHQPSASVSSATPPRPSTPKQFKIPRLGFKQVVEQVQEVSVDQAKRFADDVLRGCWITRFGEQKVQKREREGTLGLMAASFNMAFMNTTTSLPGTANTSSTNLAQYRMKGLRRPPSIQSVATTARTAQSSTSLHAVIIQYASMSSSRQGFAESLPHETEVLSVLLMPFLSNMPDALVESERIQAIETFEIAAKTWPASSNEAELERWIWCCKAAQSVVDHQHIRIRLLGILSSCLFTPGGSFRAESPLVFQSLLQGLFSLLSFLSLRQNAEEELQYVRELIAGVLQNTFADFDKALVEQEYGVKLYPGDNQSVIDCAVVIALSVCLENSSEAHRPLILRYLAEDYWSFLEHSHPSSNLATLYVRKLVRCAHALFDYLPPVVEPGVVAKDADIVFQLLQTRLIPEADSIPPSDALECQVAIERLSLKLLCLSGSVEQEGVVSFIARWYNSSEQWEAGFETALLRTIKEDSWTSIVMVLTVLVEELPDDLRASVTASFLPMLNERLVQDPPPYPMSTLTELLETVAHDYPKLFYKPLFACAAASKDTTVVAQLRILVVLSKFLPGLWTRDVEMLLVALMTGPSAAPVKDAQQDAVTPWGQARLGQLALLTELIVQVQRVGKEKESTPGADPAITTKARFFFTLEHRLGLLLEAKERVARIPMSQRILFSVLFFEIRILLRSLKSAQWLARIAGWVADIREEGFGDQEDSSSAAIVKLTSLYMASKDGPRLLQKRRSAFLLSPSTSEDSTMSTPAVDQSAGLSEMLSERFSLLKSLSRGLLRNSLRLFVAVSGLFTNEDYERIGLVLWRNALDSPDPEVQASATFLIMQAAEKAPDTFLVQVRNDLNHSEASIRRQAAKRLSLLSGWRFQLLSQIFITDKHHRRPFKLARGPISFMATDIGSGIFVPEEDPEQLKTNNGTVLPLELRKTLADIGWNQDDTLVDQKLEWIRTPLSLLSSQQVERLDTSSSQTAPRSPLLTPTSERPGSPSSDPSTSSNQGIKRRPIFVTPLASLFQDVTFLAFDPDFTVASAARSTVLDLMRDDPALITRPVFDALSGDENTIADAISVLRAFLHIQRTLPPAMAHHVFNHLTGFLKHSARQTDAKNTLRGFAYTLPLLSRLVAQVSGMSIREIRRAKVEIFLIPSGALWFPPTAPTGAMFPRAPGHLVKTDQDALFRLAHVAIVRVSQNMLFLRMLKRNPQDVQAIRKNMSRLVLPSMDDTNEPAPVELRDFIPRRPTGKYTHPSAYDVSVSGVSLVLSRSYSLLVTEIFRSMSRHLNDRTELAVLIDGLNRILLVHGDDIGVVGHILIALMTASTRFRRIFTSGGAYTLFMPAIMKIYAEAERHQGIRAAIEFATNRFYALHQEAFVFQTLDVLSQIAMLPDIDGHWMAEQIFALFSTLKSSAPLHAPDVAGIHDSNKKQEQEALLVTTAEDKPQAFLSLLRRGNGPSGNLVDIALPDQYEGHHLTFDNLVRLFLTVIGHNPAIHRAEQFLHLLQLMAPTLYESSAAARNILQEGINALSIVLSTRSSGKAKVSEGSQLRSGNESSFEVFSQDINLGSDSVGISRRPSDLAEMRLDYLSLVAAFTKSGGSFSPAASQRIIELVKIILRDSNHGGSARAATFLSEYAQNALVRQPPVRLKEVITFLNDISPVYKAYATVMDLSGVLSAISQLVDDPVYANEPTFSNIVVHQFCIFSLEACAVAASEGLLFSLPLRPVLVKLLCQSVFLAGVDIMEVLEQRPINYDYLAGIIYPMSLGLSSTDIIVRDVRWTEPWRREAPARSWVRLLALSMRACRTSSSSARDSDRPNTLQRSRSQESRKNASKGTSATSISISLQIIKVIVLRAENDLSSYIPGVWVELGIFLKNLLADGNAQFAMQRRDQSAPPSPSHSPLMRPQSLDENPFAPSSPGMKSPTRPSFAQPRILDYLLWSVLEFACLHRSPLMLQMRILMQEKSTILDQTLRQQLQLSTYGNRLSFASVFSKPRRRSGYWSGGQSPDGSPLLTPAKSISQDLFLTPPRPDERQPGYARFASPVSPGGDKFTGPTIVHLGPVRNPDLVFRRMASPAGGGGSAGIRHMWLMVKSTKMKSIPLVRATYQRIRIVQQMMGYATLLPALDGDEDGSGDVKLWSRAEALRAVARETNELMEEFREAEEEDEDTVMVDPDQSMGSV
ncbi:hypothetical protein BV25DRAFT_1820006 [Artomyces pyxidatus]|uniref:Uncharacterized protein n=1 Tax=Artomyces pyxidatus TaxID=48021 RepID=A0ACB8TEN7_9AGAM|nr:hypothetical protein BV25DRAFT_1820006 [Artomyces pyxidatus]